MHLKTEGQLAIPDLWPLFLSLSLTLGTACQPTTGY